MELSDADLVARVERGDESSFRVLYRRHTPAMYGVALRLLARRQDAEDAVQEAWLRAVRGLPGFRWESALRTWLVGIAVRCALEVGRRQRPQPPEPDTDLLSAAPSGDLSLDLEAAIAGLADGYRQVLVLHDVEGYTHARSQRCSEWTGAPRRASCRGHAGFCGDGCRRAPMECGHEPTRERH